TVLCAAYFTKNQRIELISRQISCASLSSQSRPRVSSSQSSASCSRGNWSSSGPYTSSRVICRLLVASTAAILSPLCYGGACGRWAARVSPSHDDAGELSLTPWAADDCSGSSA